ncbi:hypothetical protein QF002_000460 [Paraburkholderia youngii]
MCEARAEFVAPAADRLVTDNDTALEPLLSIGFHFSMKLPFRETCHPSDAPLPCHLVAYNLWMPNVPLHPSLPEPASLSALRAWYAGVSAREAVERYCSQALEGGQSARGVIGRIRRQLVGFALSRHRADLAQLFQCAVGERSHHRKAATRALDILPTLEIPQPQVSDVIDVWLPARVVPVLHQHGIRTLADLTVRIPRRRRWVAHDLRTRHAQRTAH